MDPLFDSRVLSKKATDDVDIVRQRFDDLLAEITVYTSGGGRHDALMRTRLEEACFWAVKAVAIQPSNWLHEK